MDTIEKIRIEKLIDSVRTNDLGEALEHLTKIAKFKQEKIKHTIIEEKFQPELENK